MYKKIFKIAIPMILSAISIPMLGIVDTAILGHLDSPKYLAAVNIGATIFNVLFWGFGFLKMSTTGLVAQSLGEHNQIKISLQVTQALFIAFLLAFLLLIFQKWLGHYSIIFSSSTGEVAEMAKEYFLIRIFSAPATLVIYVLVGYFLAIQQSKVVLLIMLMSQIGNMVLDYVFVMVFHYGISGVAYGSLISEYMALFIGGYFLYKSHYQFPQIDDFVKWLTKKDEIKRFFLLNRDIFIRTLCLMAVFALMTKGSARLGDLSLAGNAVLLNFFYLMSYGLDGFAHAVESLCGEYYGAKDKNNFKSIVKKVFVISFLTALFFSAVYWLFGKELINLLTSIPLVQNYAYEYVSWLIFIPLISMPSFVYDGVFVATTNAKIMRNSMVLATVFCYIPLWYILRKFENHGLWFSFLAFFIVRSIAIHLYYRKWIKNWES